MHNPFRNFNSSPEVIGLTVMMYIRYPPSLRQVEDIPFERGVDICHQTKLRSALGPGCSLTRGWDVKLSVLYLPASLFSPQ